MNVAALEGKEEICKEGKLNHFRIGNQFRHFHLEHQLHHYHHHHHQQQCHSTQFNNCSL